MVAMPDPATIPMPAATASPGAVQVGRRSPNPDSGCKGPFSRARSADATDHPRVLRPPGRPACGADGDARRVCRTSYIRYASRSSEAAHLAATRTMPVVAEGLPHGATIRSSDAVAMADQVKWGAVA